MSPDSESNIVHRELDSDGPAPSIQIAGIVAELKGTAATEVKSTYDCVDDVLVNLFSDPPAPEAQMEITFSYEGYRITVEEDGTAEFVEVA